MGVNILVPLNRNVRYSTFHYNSRISLNWMVKWIRADDLDPQKRNRKTSMDERKTIDETWHPWICRLELYQKIRQCHQISHHRQYPLLFYFFILITWLLRMYQYCKKKLYVYYQFLRIEIFLYARTVRQQMARPLSILNRRNWKLINQFCTRLTQYSYCQFEKFFYP